MKDWCYTEQDGKSRRLREKNKRPPPATQLGLAHTFVTRHTEKEMWQTLGFSFLLFLLFVLEAIEGRKLLSEEIAGHLSKP